MASCLTEGSTSSLLLPSNSFIEQYESLVEWHGQQLVPPEADINRACDPPDLNFRGSPHFDKTV